MPMSYPLEAQNSLWVVYNCEPLLARNSLWVGVLFVVLVVFFCDVRVVCLMGKPL